MKIDRDLNLLHVWDAESVPLARAYWTVLWRSYDSDSLGNVFSIPQYVENNAEHLRARYLSWVHDLGETHVREARVVDYLALRPGFSYWWMTQIAEKCNFEKSPSIDNAIRFMAFDEWAKDRQIYGVKLTTANHELSESMRIWCAQKAIPFTLHELKAPKIKSSLLKRIFAKFPQGVQALVWLMHYLWERWPLRGVGLIHWRSTPGRVTLVSYLFNLVPEAVTQGRFECRYWGPLPEALQKDDCATNWLHIYVKDPFLPSAKRAAELLRAWNQSGKGMQRHVSLDSFLGPSVVLRTLRDWGRLMCLGIRLGKWMRSIHHPDSYLWPLMVEDWNKSIFGMSAINNLLFFNLLETALEGQSTQERGVYLQENQGWEFGLLHAWAAAGHGRMFGCPHSSVRFWDLRYFFDPRSLRRSGKNDLPLPYQSACNGPAMWQELESAGYPRQNLVSVEALRYMHLAGQASQHSVSQGGRIRVLVLGDYRKENTHRQMQLLQDAVPLLSGDITWVVKPHPACPVRTEDYPGIALQVCMHPISELMGECDVAYSSSVTSAAVDAYCGGMPTVVALDPNTLNLSPLRGCPGVLFATKPKELAAALTFAGSKKRDVGGRTEFFTLDSKVPRWRALLLDSVPLN